MSNGLIEQIEQARCQLKECGAAIARDHTFTNYDMPNLRRTVKAYCDKCGRGWIAEQRLRGGVWCDEPEIRNAPAVRELTGKALEGLKRRVDMADGVIRHEALSA